MAHPTIYIKELNDLSEEESYKQYEIQDDAVRLVYIGNSIMNKNVDELVLANQAEWEVGDGDTNALCNYFGL